MTWGAGSKDRYPEPQPVTDKDRLDAARETMKRFGICPLCDRPKREHSKHGDCPK